MMSPLLGRIVAIVTTANVLACAWLIWWTARPRAGESAPGAVTGHVWDENLQERNEPLPRWWLGLFLLSIVFCFGYFFIYPALGSYPGLLRWSSARQYQSEVAQAQQQVAPLYRAFAGRSIESLAADRQAVALGRSLFANYCTNCHGSDARGAPGFPNLTDNDWLYGGEPQAIVQSITNGREGIMPALGPALGADGVEEVVDYVESLSGRPAPADKVAAGQARFVLCASCHGADGKGNPLLGAPNLTDDIWLYGGSDAAIRKTLMEGRHGKMPSHAWLGEDRIRVLAAYVYGLSHRP